jgi:hypothetical protein
MSPDYSKRSYLLPKGCKDLIDVIHLEASQKAHVVFEFKQAAIDPPAVKGEIVVSHKTTVGELADLLGQKPFKIIADLMELGLFANVNQTVNFGTISKVATKYGWRAKRQD